MKSSTSEFWQGEFGNEYTIRNRVNWLDRVPFWTTILSFTGSSDVQEYGCNNGWNLLAIRTIKPYAKLYGVEINDMARKFAQNLGFDVSNEPHRFKVGMSFTAGVLIHIAPENISGFMDEIIESSRKYVLAIEYESDVEQEINYRGHKGKLWKRPYGDLYKKKGLKLVDTGPAYGFDDCTYWLFEK